MISGAGARFLTLVFLSLPLPGDDGNAGDAGVVLYIDPGTEVSRSRDFRGSSSETDRKDGLLWLLTNNEDGLDVPGDDLSILCAGDGGKWGLFRAYNPGSPLGDASVSLGLCPLSC